MKWYGIMMDGKLQDSVWYVKRNNPKNDFIIVHGWYQILRKVPRSRIVVNKSLHVVELNNVTRDELASWVIDGPSREMFQGVTVIG